MAPLGLAALLACGAPGAREVWPVEPAPPLPTAGDTDVWTAPPPVPVDPGTLPQTETRPSADDPALVGRMEGLLAAIDADDPALARPAYFPKAVYVALKDLPKPARPDRDYDARLLAAFDRDVRALHQAGPAGRLVREVDGVERPIRLTSMISWRGQWYVVHLAAME